MAAQLQASYLDDEEFDEQMDIGVNAHNYTGDASYLDGQEEQRMLQQAAAEEALAGVPEAVKKYIVHLRALVNAPNPSIPDIQAAYEQGWNRLTEKYYSRVEWPEAEIIAPLVKHDEIFLTLYRELYYKHVYARLQPDFEDRLHSYENYCILFNSILNSDGPVPITLPIDWVYNIIDEFVYQYSSYVLWRGKVAGKTSDEKADLAESSHIWSSYSVLNVLYSLISKSNIQEQIKIAARGEEVDAEIAGEYGSIPLYYNLGYFSILGLVRVHVLLGDYSLALQMLDGIELNKKALFTRVTSAHVAIYYYVGFAYLMLNRYPDATRCFSYILTWILRLKHFQRGSQFDQINKTADKMYALLVICQALSPSRLDEGITTAIRERFGDAYSTMIRGGEQALQSFQDMFSHGAPRFISPNPPPYDSTPEALQAYSLLPDPSSHQLSLFLSSIKPQLSTPSLRSFLRLYSSLGIDKLATFIGDGTSEEDVVEMLMCTKGSITGQTWTQGSLLDSEPVNIGDLNFGIDQTHVTVTESKTSHRFADYFLRNSLKYKAAFDTIKAKPLPIPTKPPVTGGADAVSAAPIAAKTVAWAK